MATIGYALGSGMDGDFGALFDVAQTAASRTDGWTVAKLAAGNMADYDAGTKQATGAFAVTAKPASFVTGTTANAWKIPTALTGTFAATGWILQLSVRCTLAAAQAGRMRMRVYRSANADGSGATEVTASTQVGGTSNALSTTVDGLSFVTWTPAAAIVLSNEYLFFAFAWEILTASSNNSGDVVLRTGSGTNAGCRVTTSDYTPAAVAEVIPDVGMALTVT